MAAFGGKNSTEKYVWNYCMVLDSTKKILNRIHPDDLYARANRARTEGPLDNFQAGKDFAISSIRCIIRNSLSYGRTLAWKHILEGFVFVVDKTNTFETLSDAREGGFGVQFIQEESETESLVPMDISGTIWDMEDCENMGERSWICKLRTTRS